MSFINSMDILANPIFIVTIVELLSMKGTVSGAWRSYLLFSIIMFRYYYFIYSTGNDTGLERVLSILF